jgi:hypothetical protein
MGGEESKHRVDSLVGNLQTKIWHANSDPMTNEHAANTIGKSWQKRQNSGQSFGRDNYNLSSGESESFDYDVHPQLFTMLKKGGKPNGNIVEAILFQNGRVWNSSKKTNLLTQFKQYGQ